MHLPVGEEGGQMLRDSHAPWRLAPWNVIPEADQLSVGGCLLALMDPHMGWSRAERLRARTVAACRKMDADPDFRFGNWGCEAGGALAVAVTRHALATLPVDPQQVFLMGYSCSSPSRRT